MAVGAHWTLSQGPSVPAHLFSARKWQPRKETMSDQFVLIGLVGRK